MVIIKYVELLAWHTAFGNCIIAIAGHLATKAFIDKLLEARGSWAKKNRIAKCACIIKFCTCA